MENNRGLWIGLGIAVVLGLLCLCTCAVIGAGMYLSTVENGGEPDPFTFDPTEEPIEPTPVEPVTSEPVSNEAGETLRALEAAAIPDADMHELGIRFRGVSADTPRTLTDPAPDYPLGTQREFNVSNVDTDEEFQITAELVYKTPHVYMWVENGAQADLDELKAAADLFEEQTYPTNREFFGSEWTPGVDNDVHLSVLHARGLGSTVAGYFSSPDCYVRTVRPDSNQMEMFYINIENVTVGDSFYNGVLSHEFQHMIHWYNDRNEDTWLNEGSSELATAINSRKNPGTYEVGGNDWSYANRPDTQLTTWPEGTAGNAAPNYGASYLFMSYFLDRFGDEATQKLIANPQNGMESVDAVLAELDQPLTHQELFADWLIANYLDDPDLAQGQYGYREMDPIQQPELDYSYNNVNSSKSRRSTVAQYGVDYIEVKGREPLHLNFTGSSQIGLLDTQAHSGKYLWWSNRADESDSRLTRRVDLHNASQANLEFWSWYHIEEDWDYAYVVVGSTADGTLPDDLNDPEIHWKILDDSALDCTDSNPNGNAVGCGLTGESTEWQKRSADLSEFTGKEIALRFEYITDSAVNQPGFAIDDITVTADGKTILDDDAEAGAEEWLAEGFVRHANILPQEWLVEMILFGDQPTVQRLLLADGTQGEWTIPLSSDTRRAVLVISALAPVTTEAAPYEITVAPE